MIDNTQTVSEKNLASFITLGYFLDYHNFKYKIDTSGINKKKYAKISGGELIKIGSSLLRKAISENFDINKEHLVPISGGLDSRFILAGLLEHTQAKNIYTYTYGTPKTLDYEIGNYIARKSGTKHTKFNLTQHTYNQDELEDISKRVEQQTVLFHHWPVWKVDKVFSDFIVWSGFMGDPLAGSHLSVNPSVEIEKAKQTFIEKNRYIKSIHLEKTAVNFANLIDCELIDNKKLTLDEQLDFQNRQIKYVAPHVLMRGYNYKTPFLYQPWVNFILSVDNKYRYNQSLYKSILWHSFPKFFSYKTKINGGLSLNPSKFEVFTSKLFNKIQKQFGPDVKSKYTNYLDFNKSIRDKKDIKEIVQANILDLHKRNLIDWIDIRKIFDDHIKGTGNYADALIVLCSLEIHLKTGKSYAR
jgi:hypothetical protein